MQLTYDREHDRLVGADVVRTFQGRPAKSLLMPKTRAMSLKDALQALQEAYRRHGRERMPLPHVLALIDPGFALAADLGLPQGYDELCQVVTIIPEGPILTQRLPQSDDDGRDFAETLFSVLRSGHDVDLTFGTDRTLTSIKAENVTSAGAFVDLYYLASARECSKEAVARGRTEDIANALALVWMACGRTPDQWRSSLHTAMEAYRQITVTERIEQVAKTAYNSLGVSGPAQADSILAALASSILADPLSSR